VYAFLLIFFEIFSLISICDFCTFLVIDVYFFWLQSDICHLSKLKPMQLIAKGEHAEEWGGYFIIGGHERLIRMLQMTRRNYPFSVTRTSWKKRGNLFSDLGVMIRCVKDDQTATVSIRNLIRNCKNSA
jgi:DNA-directed RNA polymerase I subunit RPA2